MALTSSGGLQTGDAAEAARAGRAEVDAVLACLPGLTCREACDDVAVSFCYVNSKGARKRMVRPNWASLAPHRCSLSSSPCHITRLSSCQKASSAERLLSMPLTVFPF